MQNSTYENFVETLAKEFPGLDVNELRSKTSPELISPFKLKLPKSILTKASESVRAFFHLRQHPQVLQALHLKAQSKGLIDPGNYSILMSYDFHLDEQLNPKLIEINTNAAFLALGWFLYKSRKIPAPVSDFSMDEIRANILEEFRLFSKDSGQIHKLNLNSPKSDQPFSINIIDDDPQSQKLYLEFLVFRELFRSWGWACEISDFRQIGEAPHFIYNRFTDFLLSRPESAGLRSLFVQKSTCISPNPFEYLCLADKSRLSELSSEFENLNSLLSNEDFKAIEACLLKSQVLDSNSKDEIWQRRKKVFIKPAQAFGAKQSYRGESVSRKIFDEACRGNFIAQDYCPAPTAIFKDSNGEDITFKYDLRFYAYQDRIQMVIARLYQGQVTNLKTPLGGFACVEFLQ